MPQKPWRNHYSLPFGENRSARYPCPFSYKLRERTKIYTDVPQGTSASSDTALRHVDSRFRGNDGWNSVLVAASPSLEGNR